MPAASPLKTITPPHAWESWWGDWEGYVLDQLMHDAYHGVPVPLMSKFQEEPLMMKFALMKYCFLLHQ